MSDAEARCSTADVARAEFWRHFALAIPAAPEEALGYLVEAAAQDKRFESYVLGCKEHGPAIVGAVLASPLGRAVHERFPAPASISDTDQDQPSEDALAAVRMEWVRKKKPR